VLSVAPERRGTGADVASPKSPCSNQLRTMISLYGGIAWLYRWS
jgi:hypothetical protein